MSVMPGAKNQPDDIKIRKCRDILVTGGIALIAFGVWTVIQGVLEISEFLGNLLNGMTYEGLSEAEMEMLREMISDRSLLYGVVGLAILLTAIDLAIRIYVGLSARAAGLQKRKKNGKERNGIVWIILGFLLAAIGIYSLVNILLTTGGIVQEYSVLYYVILLFVEVTSLVVTVELMITGIRLRRLTGKQKGSEEVRDAA